MKGMTVEQANYCDNLKTGNVEVWHKGFSSLDLNDEYHIHIASKLPRMSFFELMENESVAIRVADQAILKSMRFKFEPADLDLHLLSTISELDQVKKDTGMYVSLDLAVQFEEDAVNVTRRALKKLS